jgi:hypothetical protein
VIPYHSAWQHLKQESTPLAHSQQPVTKYQLSRKPYPIPGSIPNMLAQHQLANLMDRMLLG